MFPYPRYFIQLFTQSLVVSKLESLSGLVGAFSRLVPGVKEKCASERVRRCPVSNSDQLWTAKSLFLFVYVLFLLLLLSFTSQGCFVFYLILSFAFMFWRAGNDILTDFDFGAFFFYFAVKAIFED